MKYLSILTVPLAALLLTACSQTPLRFYMLDAEIGAPAAAANLPAETVLGLGPIRLPAYLDRPQLVMALGDYQYQLDEKHRWAERLDENVARALSLSLARQLGIEQVVRYPWSPRQTVNYQLSFDILEMHQTATGQSRLTAQWQLKTAEKTVAGKRFECVEPAGEAAEAIVAAQSRCLSRFSMELANAVRQVAGR